MGILGMVRELRTSFLIKEGWFDREDLAGG